jgi:hypothetical protein
MNLKTLVVCVVTLAGLCLGTAQAQYSKMPAGDKAPAMGTGLATADVGSASLAPATPSAGAVPQLSDWITYCQNNCHFPLGGNGSIQYELYMRNGISFPIGGGFFGHTLKDGWIIQGGGRTLFFNPEGDAAWVVDVGLTNINNDGKNFQDTATLNNEVRLLTPANPFTGLFTSAQIDTLPISTQELNRAFFNLGLGREHYFAGPPQGDTWTWRVGYDVGGRWGSAKLSLHDRFDLLNPPRTDIIAGGHRNDTIGSIYLSLHSDVEIPYGCITLLAGVRLEWAYTWMEILQPQNDTNTQEINLLFNTGFRF